MNIRKQNIPSRNSSEKWHSIVERALKWETCWDWVRREVVDATAFYTCHVFPNAFLTLPVFSQQPMRPGWCVYTSVVKSRHCEKEEVQRHWRDWPRQEEMVLLIPQYWDWLSVHCFSYSLCCASNSQDRCGAPSVWGPCSWVALNLTKGKISDGVRWRTIQARGIQSGK